MIIIILRITMHCFPNIILDPPHNTYYPLWQNACHHYIPSIWQGSACGNPHILLFYGNICDDSKYYQPQYHTHRLMTSCMAIYVPSIVYT